MIGLKVELYLESEKPEIRRIQVENYQKFGEWVNQIAGKSINEFVVEYRDNEDDWIRFDTAEEFEELRVVSKKPIRIRISAKKSGKSCTGKDGKKCCPIKKMFGGCEKKKNCCEKKKACCEKKKCCCPIKKMFGGCEKKKSCCEKKKNCCEKKENCCEKKKKCCEKKKKCCAMKQMKSCFLKKLCGGGGCQKKCGEKKEEEVEEKLIKGEEEEEDELIEQDLYDNLKEDSTDEGSSSIIETVEEEEEQNDELLYPSINEVEKERKIDFSSELKVLGDMGFGDEKANILLLQENGGDVKKVIATLLK